MEPRLELSRWKYELAIACVFQDEARYLREWIEFHRLMGVQHFMLVNDRSSDDFTSVLRDYVESGEVSMFSSPCPTSHQGEAWPIFQRDVLDTVVRHLRGIARWVALIDVDEFIVPRYAVNVIDVLREHEQYGAAYVRWKPFGTSYVTRLAKEELVIERLVLRQRVAPGHDLLGKSIVKPHEVSVTDIHRCELVRDSTYVEEAPLDIHHYWSRDEHFLLNYKLPRTARIKGWTLSDETVRFYRELFNDVRDDTMARFIPALRLRLEQARARD